MSAVAAPAVPAAPRRRLHGEHLDLDCTLPLRGLGADGLRCTCGDAASPHRGQRLPRHLRPTRLGTLVGGGPLRCRADRRGCRPDRRTGWAARGAPELPVWTEVVSRGGLHQEAAGQARASATGPGACAAKRPRSGPGARADGSLSSPIAGSHETWTAEAPTPSRESCGAHSTSEQAMRATSAVARQAIQDSRGAQPRADGTRRTAPLLTGHGAPILATAPSAGRRTTKQRRSGGPGRSMACLRPSVRKRTCRGRNPRHRVRFTAPSRHQCRSEPITETSGVWTAKFAATLSRSGRRTATKADDLCEVTGQDASDAE